MNFEQLSTIKAYNADCMQIMKQYPDKYFDLAIVDPPYGLGIDGQRKSINKTTKYNRKEHKSKGWDNSIPELGYLQSYSEYLRIKLFGVQITW